MQRIDAHIHFMGDDPAALELLDELDLKLLNISVAGKPDTWRQRADEWRRLAREYPDRYAWCTSFDLPDFEDPGYIDRVLADLERDFAAGAVACKVWKNVGMEARDADGRLILVDDTRLDPIWEYLIRVGKPLLAHIAEPLACWQPLAPGRPHYGYYSKNPQWHMHGRRDMPSHADLIATRDHVVERHPRLRVIGAHLGSLEYDVAEVARRLERYPNFAVDVSARLADLAWQDSATVRQFLMDFPDRILFGTDIVTRLPKGEATEADREGVLSRMRRTYATYFAYFETEERVTVDGHETPGLGLPADVLERFYRENARAWYPGL